MPNNFEQLTLKGFKRVNEFADAETLDATELTKLENMVLDSQGSKAVKRGGFSSYNANSAGAGIYSLHDVVDSGGNNLLLAVVGTTLKKSTSGTGTWSNVKTGLTSNLKSRLTTFNDRFFLSNDTDAPYSTDGTNVWSLGLSRLDVASLTTANGGSSGRMTINSKYKWMLVAITNLGEFSPPSRPFTHYIEQITNLTTSTANTAVTFTSLPLSGDTRAVSRYLFRTKADGEVFYLAARLDNVATFYTDDKADTELNLSIAIKYSQQVSTGKYIEAHKERLFLGNVGLTDDAPLITHAKGTNIPVGVASNIDGNLAAGIYQYYILWVDGFNRVSYAIAIANVTVTASEDTVTLYNLPIPSSANIEAKIFRKLTTESTYKYVTSYTGNIITDDVYDISANAAMPSSTSSSTTYPSGVIFSEIGKPAEISPYNIIQIFPDDADEITGLVDDRDGVIVIKKNSICKIFTNGNPLNWRVEKLYSQIGCDQPNSIQKIGDRIYFISNKYVYRYPDYVNAPLSIAIKNTMTNVSSVVDAAYSSINQWYIFIASLTSALTGVVLSASIFSGGTEYTEGDILTLSTGGTLATVRVDSTGGGESITGITLLSGGTGYSTGNSNTTGGTGISAVINITAVSTAKRLIAYNEKLECWYHFYSGNQTWECITEKIYGTDRGTLITGHTAVNVLTKYNTAVSVDSDGANDVEIAATLRTKTFTLPEATSLVRLRKLFANYKKKDNQTVTHILCDPQKAIQRSGVDTTNATDSTDYKDYEVITDAMTKTVGTLNTCRKLYYEITGYGLTEFNVMKLFYRIINRGSRAI